MILLKDKICSYKIIDNQEVIFVNYKKAIHFLGFTFRKEGFYHFNFVESDTLLTDEELKKYVVKGNKIFYKPFIFINMVDNNGYRKYFDSLYEASEWINNNISEVGHKISI